MFDPLESPRVRQLLEEAEQAAVLLQKHPSLAVRETLDGIHRDLGKAIHGLVRQRRTPQPEVVDSNALPDFGEESEPTQIPSADDLARLLDDPAVEVVTRRMLGGLVISPALRNWLALLEPGDLLDPDALPEEAGKVQWASGDLPAHLTDAVRSTQLAVLGLLAARARHLVNQLDVDIGPRMALERLTRFQTRHKLPAVPGLTNRPPEDGSWAADARGYWELLRSA